MVYSTKKDGIVWVLIGYYFSISTYYNTYIQTISEHSYLRLYSFSGNNAVICFSLKFHLMVTESDMPDDFPFRFVFIWRLDVCCYNIM